MEMDQDHAEDFSGQAPASTASLRPTAMVMAKHLSFDEMLDIIKGLLSQVDQLQAQVVEFQVSEAELFTEATMLLDPAIMQSVREARQKASSSSAQINTTVELKDENNDNDIMDQAQPPSP